MTTQKILISCYYAVTLVLLSGSVVRAVVTGGAHVSFGREVAVRQAEKQQLLDTKADLESQIAAAQSLNAVQPVLADSEFVAVQNPIQLSLDTSLASR